MKHSNHKVLKDESKYTVSDCEEYDPRAGTKPRGKIQQIRWDISENKIYAQFLS